MFETCIVFGRWSSTLTLCTKCPLSHEISLTRGRLATSTARAMAATSSLVSRRRRLWVMSEIERLFLKTLRKKVNYNRDFVDAKNWKIKPGQCRIFVCFSRGLLCDNYWRSSAGLTLLFIHALFPWQPQAEGLVLSLRDLFQVVFEMKKREVEEARKQQDSTGDVTDQPTTVTIAENTYDVSALFIYIGSRLFVCSLVSFSLLSNLVIPTYCLLLIQIMISLHGNFDSWKVCGWFAS